jgi:hypothetical protein
MDKFTQTTNTSYFSNLGNSFKGILVGFCLILGAIALLFYNEYRSINQTQAIEEVASNLVVLSATKYHPQYEKKPILIYGKVQTKDLLQDDKFLVTSSALKLKRVVEMYQWKEEKTTTTQENSNGSTDTTTVYKYNKKWVAYQVDSSNFKHSQYHENPNMPYESLVFLNDAQVGDFSLPKSSVDFFPFKEGAQNTVNLPKKVGGFSKYQNFLYKGLSPQSPEIGDVKVIYQSIPVGNYSIIAMVYQKSLIPYLTQNNINLIFIRDKKMSAAQIIEEEFSSNSTFTWLLRLLGLALMYVGFSLIMKPISVLVKIIPFLGGIIQGTTSIVAGILTAIFGTTIIAIAWFSVRPILSISLLIAGVGVVYFIKKKEVKTQ